MDNKTTTLHFKNSFHKLLKIESAKREIPMSELVEKAVKEFLRNNS